MLRRRLLTLVLGAALLALGAPTIAAGFDPATQSHEGACSRETTRVSQALHDFAANGVLADFAHLIGIHGSRRSLAGNMEKRLTVGWVRRRVVTENHGCDGAGDWFAVGSRVLHAGERVGVKAPAKLRSLLCSSPSSRCRRVTLTAHVVFPTNCWNPNMGTVQVAVYVHKRPRKKPKPKSHVEANREEAAPPAETPVPTPTAAPSASAAAQGCSNVVVTLSNASSATASATFLIDGTSHGPIAPGGSEAVTIAIPAGSGMSITVSSGSSVLVNGESFANTCVAAPVAKLLETKYCVSPEYLTEAEIELSNGAAATLPASFLIEWTGTKETRESKQYGPIAPGGSETVTLAVGPPPPPSEESWGEFKVISEGKTLLEDREVGVGC